MKKFLVSLFLLTAMAATAQAKDLPDFTEIVEKQGPAVVNINTIEQPQRAPHPQAPKSPKHPSIPQPPDMPDDEWADFFRRFMPQPPGAPDGQRGPERKNVGSGFIISTDGYILTNAHVVHGAENIFITLTDKREFKAKVIGADRRTDVALVKIEAVGLPVVAIGDPNKLKVGAWVLAIGSPFAFDNTVTAGIVSAKGRDLPQENLVPFIQTDAAINPGNSGGPLFNLNGEVVGINSQIYSRTGGFMGLSFAIPIDVAMDVANQLRKGGKVSRGWLGVVIQEVTKDLADSFGLAKPQGALVASVEKGSPADKGGVETSDVILKFDGKAVTNSRDLPRLVAAVKPGTKVNIQVWRKGTNKELHLSVGELPAERAPHSRPAKREAVPEPAPNKLGLVLSELTAEQRQELAINGGLVVDDAQDAAARAGIQRGDVILAVNNIDVTTVEQFNQAIAKLDPKRSVALLVRRGESSIYIPIKISGNGGGDDKSGR